MKKFIAGMLIIAASALFLSADVYIKSNSHTDAMSMMGQTTPATDTVSELWIGDNALAMVSQDGRTVIDLAKNTFAMINMAEKSYVETALPVDFAKLLPAEMASMADVRHVGDREPTGETKKVGSWNCQGYDMTMTVMGMPMKTKIWASTEVAFDWAKFSERFMPAMTKGMMRLDASVKEMMKIKGYQIASEVNAEMMGAKIHSTTTVAEISMKAAPAGIYGIPAGFTKKATLVWTTSRNGKISFLCVSSQAPERMFRRPFPPRPNQNLFNHFPISRPIADPAWPAGRREGRIRRSRISGRIGV